jgi:hypothetical protein
MGREMDYYLLKNLAMMQEERDLYVLETMPRKDFQELFKQQNEDTTTSP